MDLWSILAVGSEGHGSLHASKGAVNLYLNFLVANSENVNRDFCLHCLHADLLSVSIGTLSLIAQGHSCVYSSGCSCPEQEST